MASRLGLPLFVSTVVLCLAWAQPPSTALAAGLDEQGEAQAKEASQLYKQGHYEEAASIFAKLSVEYPEMAIFDRNLGACFFYLRKPDPALSNLRRYLSRKKNIGADDKAVVDRWIDEMEKVRAQGVPSEVAPATPAELHKNDAKPMDTREPTAVTATVPVMSYDYRRGRGLRHAGVACAILGGAALATGLVFSVLTSEASKDVEDRTRTQVVQSSAVSDKLSRGPFYETMQWVSYGIGAGSLVTGAVLYYVGVRSAVVSQTSAQVSPLVVAGGTGATLRLPF